MRAKSILAAALLFLPSFGYAKSAANAELQRIEDLNIPKLQIQNGMSLLETAGKLRLLSSQADPMHKGAQIRVVRLRSNMISKDRLDVPKRWRGNLRNIPFLESMMYVAQVYNLALKVRPPNRFWLVDIELLKRPDQEWLKCPSD